MKFTVKGVRVDFPESLVKRKTREAFIDQWSKKVWLSAPEDVRRDELGNVWDVMSRGLTQRTTIQYSGDWAKEEKETIEVVEKAVELIETVKPRNRKKNGTKGHTAAPEDVES